MKPPAWMRQAACAGEDPEMFFEGAREDEAKAVCRDCPVEAECYGYARLEGIDHGVWGGMTAAERKAARRKRKPINHGTYNGYRMHLRRGELACAACLKAHADYQWLARQKTAAAPQYTKCAHRTGRPCQQWALKGQDLCWVHAGRPDAQENRPGRTA